jgi:hypothetical protein
MKRIVSIALCPVVFALFMAAQQTFPDSCAAGKTAHFPSKTATGIDALCPPEGVTPKDKPGDGPQNKVKNNFCADSDTPTPITLDDIRALQGAVDDQEKTMKPPPKKPPLERAFLTDLKEGRLVVFEGFIFDATQECGETVNCGGNANVPNTNASHDIHIALLEKPRTTQETGPKPEQDKEECTGFVAEMVPHHRPPEWTECNVKDVAKRGLKVRVTGQQFFDGSHSPCKNGEPDGDNPKRVSLWEIHPIYSFEVCPSGGCDSGGWKSLEEFDAGKTSCPEKKCEEKEQ